MSLPLGTTEGQDAAVLVPVLVVAFIVESRVFGI